jgi:transposase
VTPNLRDGYVERDAFLFDAPVPFPSRFDQSVVNRPGSCRDFPAWKDREMSGTKPYPQDLRERAVRMVAEVRPNYESDWATIAAVAAKLGIGTAETLRKWVRQAQVDAGRRPGVTTEESVELRRLRAEVRELRRANEILKAASAFFAAELDRPQTHS